MKQIAGWILACALCAPFAGAQTSPRLEHGAPWLGSDLELTLSDAPPFAAVRFLESDARGALPTPYGLFELDRSLARVVANGTTDASGRLDLTLAIPLDPALAETEAHYQALVEDSAAPGGWVLSEAAHLRRAGPRLYANAFGRPTSDTLGPEPGGLAVVSAVTRQLVATVDYGVPPVSYTQRTSEAQPVLSRTLARGAVVSPSGDLLFFDPFFGEVLGTQPLDDGSRRLALTGGGTVAVALEPGSSENGTPYAPARLLTFDMESGDLLGTLSLQRSVSRRWIWSPESDEAYLVELGTQGGPISVRRVGLAGLVDRGEVLLPVDGPHRFGPHLVRGLAVDGAALFVATFDWAICLGPTGGSKLTRIDYGLLPPLVKAGQTDELIRGLTPVPELGSLYSFRSGSVCWGPGYNLHQSRLEDPLPGRSFQPLVGLEETMPPEMEWDGTRLWIPYPMDTDGAWGLGWFDTGTEEWTKLAHPYGTGPLQVELLRDALVETAALISSDNLVSLRVESRVHFRNLATGELEEHVAVRPWVESLLGIPLP